MKPHQHINQDSGNTEYYSPKFIVEAARLVMGEIEFDPASSEKANEVIMAARFFGPNDDSLNRSWGGNVWMNHPFGLHVDRSNEKWAETCAARGCPLDAPFIPGNADWINKLMAEFTKGNIAQACCLTFAATSECWFRPLLQYPQCFLVPRTNYYLPDGTIKKGVTKGSVVTYLGQNVDRFKAEFSKLGVVKIVA